MKLNKKQKILTISLSLFCASALVLGFVMLYETVYGPLYIGENMSLSELNREYQKASLREMMRLQGQDSDKDGLSDFDELYTYGTSPFIEDTDSDGISDKGELALGMDPTCHKDSDCSGDAFLPPDSESEFNEIIPPFEMSDTFSSVPAFEDGDFSAEQLRTMLLQSGFPEDQLNRLTDEQLLSTWEQVLSGEGASLENDDLQGDNQEY